MLVAEELFKFARDKITLVLFFTIFYILVYLASREIGLANTLKTSGAIIFLPAGVRLLACLVGRAWGALGILIGSFFVVVPTTFPNEASSFHFLIAFTNTCSVLVSVVLTLEFFKVSDDLSNLKFIYLPLIDLIATFSQAFFFILILYSANLIEESELLPRFITQMTGNFLGGMIFMLSFFALMKLLKLRNTIR
jgi:hypothetical protein